MSMHCRPPPHDGVAAEADTAPIAPTPPTRASVAAPASSLLLMDINVPFLETKAVPSARLLLPAIRPGNKPERYGPIRTGTADLIVVLLKGEDHRASPEALWHVGHGVLRLDSGLS